MNALTRTRLNLLALEDRTVPSVALATESVNLRASGNGNSLTLDLVDTTNGRTFALDDAVLTVLPVGREVMRSDPQFAFIGAAPGETITTIQGATSRLVRANLPGIPFELQPVSIVVDPPAPGRLNLGVSTSTGTFPSASATLDAQLLVSAVRGPGAFSAYTVFDSIITVLASTSDGLSGADLLSAQGVGEPKPLFFSFTKPGLYEIDFVVSGTLNNFAPPVPTLTPGGPFTLRFNVEAPPEQVPLVTPEGLATTLDVPANTVSPGVQAFPGFSGAVRTVLADVDGDSVPDTVAAAGAGGGPHVRVFSGSTGQEIASFFAFGQGFTGGVQIAAGNFDSDIAREIVVAAGPGAGPHVRVLKIVAGQPVELASALGSFFAFDPLYTGGVEVAAGRFGGSGRDDLLAGSMRASSHVRIFSSDGLELSSFFAYAPEYTGGVSLASGDVDGDGRFEVITASRLPQTHVRVLGGGDASERASFFLADSGTRGVRIAVADANGDGLADLLVGPSSPSATTRILSGIDQTDLGEITLNGAFLG